VLADEYHVAHSTIRCEPAGHTDRESPGMSAARRPRAVLAAAALAALAVDIASKVAASAGLADGAVRVGPLLTLRLVHNSGFAFGIGAAAPAALVLAATAAVAVVIGVMA